MKSSSSTYGTAQVLQVTQLNYDIRLKVEGEP